MTQAKREHADHDSTSVSLRSAAAPTLTPRAMPRAVAAPSGGQSCIGRELTIQGTISGGPTLESLFIEGVVKGKIELPASRVAVGPSGRVEGPITACDIVVLGEVAGEVNAAHRIDIRAGARITGNVCAPRVIMEDGAEIRGTLIAGVDTAGYSLTGAGVKPFTEGRTSESHADAFIALQVTPCTDWLPPCTPA